MAKPLAIVGISAEDWSYCSLLVGLAIANASVRDLLPDPPPNNIQTRMANATLVSPSSVDDLALIRILI